MYCSNHPEVPAVGVCVGCGIFLCKECLQEIKGKFYCTECTNELFDAANRTIENLQSKQSRTAGGNGASSYGSFPAANNGPMYPPQGTMKRYNRSKVAAALLAFFLGGFGIHKFYLGRTAQGILYLLFCWSFVPSFIAFIEFIIYLTMSDANFDSKYNY